MRGKTKGQAHEATTTERALARDVLVMAALGGMPDSYWGTDSRIERACRVLDWTYEKARAWAQGKA